MPRRMMVSALFVAALFSVVALAQPPVRATQLDDGKKQPLDLKAKPADPDITAALANDPDVKVARAKVQLAEAELTKARQAIVLRVLTLKASSQELQTAYQNAKQRFEASERSYKTGQIDQRQLLVEREKIEAAHAAYIRVETELRLLTGRSHAADLEGTAHLVPEGYNASVARAMEWLMKAQGTETAKRASVLEYFNSIMRGQEALAVKGPIPSRIRAALDKQVRLGTKGEKVTFEKAMELFKKDAGLDVPFREQLNPPPGGVRGPVELVSQGEELPVVAWLQLFQDANGGVLYVREYGLLFTDKDTAPPDAVTVTDFWKQKPAPVTDPEGAPAPKRAK